MLDVECWMFKVGFHVLPDLTEGPFGHVPAFLFWTSAPSRAVAGRSFWRSTKGGRSISRLQSGPHRRRSRSRSPKGDGFCPFAEGGRKLGRPSLQLNRSFRMAPL